MEWTPTCYQIVFYVKCPTSEKIQRLESSRINQGLDICTTITTEVGADWAKR